MKVPKRESFEERLRKQEEDRKLNAITDATVRADAKASEDFCFANAPGEARRLKTLIGECVARANVAIGSTPAPFVFQENQLDTVRRGLAAAQVLYSQPIMNAGPQSLSIAVYAASPIGSIMPAGFGPKLPPDKRRELRPTAVNTKDGFAIRWRERGRDSMTSEEVAESTVEEVASQYDAVVRMNPRRR